MPYYWLPAASVFMPAVRFVAFDHCIIFVIVICRRYCICSADRLLVVISCAVAASSHFLIPIFLYSRRLLRLLRAGCPFC
jgi:hypothetical protein